jgi:hypothetical protein
MTRLALALAAVFAAFAAQAQQPPPGPDGKTATRQAQRHKAIETCKSAQPDKRRDCMRHELCAHAKDPVQCEARARQRAERRKGAKPSS